MAYLTQPLGGFSQPGALPPPRNYFPGPGPVQGGLGPPLRLGPPGGGYTTQGGLPPPVNTGGGNYYQDRRYGGGYSGTGGAGRPLPAGQGDGPPIAPKSITLGLPGNTLPPITPGPVPIGGTRPPGQPPITMPGGAGAIGGGRNWGTPGNKETGEMKGIYGGPPARMNMVVDPRTGQRARGAADILASMVQGGWRPKDNPNYAFSFADADKMKADAMAGLIAAYNKNELDWNEARMVESYLRTGSMDEWFSPQNLWGPDLGPFEDPSVLDDPARQDYMARQSAYFMGPGDPQAQTYGAGSTFPAYPEADANPQSWYQDSWDSPGAWGAPSWLGKYTKVQPRR